MTALILLALAAAALLAVAVDKLIRAHRTLDQLTDTDPTEEDR